MHPTTRSLSVKHDIATATLITFSVLGLLFALQNIGWAAGAPARKPSPPAAQEDKRQQADKYFQEAEVYQKQEDWAQAAALYEKAVTADPQYAEAHSNLGYCYRKQKMYDRAVRSYKRAITLEPDLAEAHEYLGEAYAETGQFDLAEKELATLRQIGSEEAEELAAFIAKLKP